MFYSTNILYLTFALKHILVAVPKLILRSCFKLFTFLNNPYIFAVVFFTRPFPPDSLWTETPLTPLRYREDCFCTGKAGLA